MGWIGDPIETMTPRMFADADLAGYPVTERSTSGLFLAIRGAHSCFPIAFGFKRQGACANCIVESELASMTYTQRPCGLPSITLWELQLPTFKALYAMRTLRL